MNWPSISCSKSRMCTRRIRWVCGSNARWNQIFPTERRNSKRGTISSAASEERRLYGDCDILVATTPPQLDLVVREYGIPAPKVRMVPPGYDDHPFLSASYLSRAAIRERLGFKGKVILALGRLAREQGLLPLMAARDAEAVLHLAVGGAEMNALEKSILADLKERAVNTGYESRIQFGSFIADDELADHYRAADIFVFASPLRAFARDDRDRGDGVWAPRPW